MVFGWFKSSTGGKEVVDEPKAPRTRPPTFTVKEKVKTRDPVHWGRGRTASTLSGEEDAVEESGGLSSGAVWEVQLKGAFKPIPDPETQQKLEDAFNRGCAVVELPLMGATYSFDMRKMTQKNMATQRQRRIRRKVTEPVEAPGDETPARPEAEEERPGAAGGAEDEPRSSPPPKSRLMRAGARKFSAEAASPGGDPPADEVGTHSARLVRAGASVFGEDGTRSKEMDKAYEDFGGDETLFFLRDAAEVCHKGYS